MLNFWFSMKPYFTCVTPYPILNLQQTSLRKLPCGLKEASATFYALNIDSIITLDNTFRNGAILSASSLPATSIDVSTIETKRQIGADRPFANGSFNL